MNDTYVMQSELLNFIDEWSEKDPSVSSDRKLALKADISPSTISKARTGMQEIGWEACIKIADALGVSPQVVLVKAGHLEPPNAEWDADTEELVRLFAGVDPEDREMVMMILRHKASSNK